LDNFLIFESQKVSRFGKLDSTAKVQKFHELHTLLSKFYMQKIVNRR